MNSMYFEITDGAILVGVTVTGLDDGTLRFDLSVLTDNGHVGDLNGLFFDTFDDALVGGLSVDGADVTGSNIKANSVTRVDGYNNVNGDVVKQAGKFDVGVQFGTEGIGKDDIQSTSFVLSHKTEALTLDMIAEQDFAVRLTSTGLVGGSREGSVKIGGVSDAVSIVVDPDPAPIPEPTPEPTPEPIPDPEPPAPGPANLAVNDSMTVSNQQTFNEGGFTDPLDGFQFSLLDNDLTSDGSPYGGVLTAANGQEWTEGLIVQGSNGGLLLVFANGTVDFSANGEFDHLGSDGTATTQFAYTIEGGSTAMLDVLVFGTGGSGGGGDDGDMNGIMF